jgi:hypothetical protein
LANFLFNLDCRPSRRNSMAGGGAAVTHLTLHVDPFAEAWCGNSPTRKLLAIVVC